MIIRTCGFSNKENAGDLREGRFREEVETEESLTASTDISFNQSGLERRREVRRQLEGRNLKNIPRVFLFH